MIFLNRVEENCPKIVEKTLFDDNGYAVEIIEEPCNGQAGRRNNKGLWTCKSCGHTWKKTLNIAKES